LEHRKEQAHYLRFSDKHETLKCEFTLVFFVAVTLPGGDSQCSYYLAESNKENIRMRYTARQRQNGTINRPNISTLADTALISSLVHLFVQTICSSAEL